jgi:hypothetical protein
MYQQMPKGQQDHVNPDLLQKTLHQLLEQIAKRDQKIAERDALLLYTQAQLKERETQLQGIESSKCWKIMVFIQRIHVFLVSSNSRRVQMLRRVWTQILSPLRKIRRD